MISEGKRILYNYFVKIGLTHKIEEYQKRFPELIEKPIVEVKPKEKKKSGSKR